MEQLIKTLQGLHATHTGKEDAPHYSTVVYGSAWERRGTNDHYNWHGLKRGADPTHPFVIFQYTLAGRGGYREGDIVYNIQPGMAFTALVPSNHSYFLPENASQWAFFWIIIHHPYIVERLTTQVQQIGALTTIAPESMLIQRALELLECIYHPAHYDPFMEEEALFRFLLAYERHVFNQRYPQPERERLLQSVRTSTLRALPQALKVEHLAEARTMSRSAFSHHFKTLTGLSPAQFMLRVRLEEATHRLLYTSQRLEDIALATGFASATHFCRVFRRHFHLSPGEFRQMRPQFA